MTELKNENQKPWAYLVSTVCLWPYNVMLGFKEIKQSLFPVVILPIPCVTPYNIYSMCHTL